MTTLLTILRLLPSILQAVQAVEAAIPLPAAGKAKLDLVLGAVSDVYTSGQQVTQEVPLDHLLTFLTQTISRIVATFNALGLFHKSA